MTKSQISAHFATKFGLKKKVANEFFLELANLAYKEAPNQFTFPGIGKLVLVDRKARQALIRQESRSFRFLQRKL